MARHLIPVQSSSGRPRPLVTVAIALASVALVGCFSWGGGASVGPPRDAAQSAMPAAPKKTLIAALDDPVYPSARACAGCHPQHYREWSVSPHSYAQMSPVFNSFQSAVVLLTNGTFNDFCIRCHTPVGMALGEPILVESNLQRHPTSREGITCITCHRVRHREGKNSGRMELSTGSVSAPVVGPKGNEVLNRVLEDSDREFPGLLTTDPDEVLGVRIHGDVEQMEYLAQPGFCGVCHDVTLKNGFRLEEAFSDYKTSPAAKRGVTCQDCHMGKVPGRAEGYSQAPAAIVNNVPTPARKHTNHMFAGPDHSIIDVPLFPHLGPDALEISEWFEDWQAFRHDEGWGSEGFERSLITSSSDRQFPPPWNTTENRKRGRKILDGQYRLLDEYREEARAVLAAGYQLGDIVVDEASEKGISFRVQFSSGTDGHSIPTGFIAERTVYLEVTVRDSEGAVVFQSGDTDPNGDVRDLHSLYVHNGELPLDPYLFSLQSRFLTRNIRGGEREQVLAVNHSVDPLPFLRPATLSTIATGRPLGARIHRIRLEPLGERWPRYDVEAAALTGKPPYRARVRLISGMVPLNLIHEISVMGFDYGLSAQEVGRRIVEGRLTLYDKEIVLEEGR